VGERLVVSQSVVAVEVAPPSGDEAHRLLWAYFDELVTRHQGRPGTEAEVRESMAEAPSDDLVAPTGVFWLARVGAEPVGCIGLRFGPGRVGQVTRMFVLESARGRGVGLRLLEEVEVVARGHGITRLELETRADLVEARRLYGRVGFVEVPAFNAVPYAEHWYAKDLDG
jgi:GNAT superfamily N-acetyltransferase